jgi:hypothetical protein
MWMKITTGLEGVLSLNGLQSSVHNSGFLFKLSRPFSSSSFINALIVITFFSLPHKQPFFLVIFFVTSIILKNYILRNLDTCDKMAAYELLSKYG